MAESALAPGARIAHYRVDSRIGSGGMGQVYRAIDLTLERPVALKTLRPQFLGDPERVRRFVQEARSASALNHPNIVTIYEIGQARVQIDDVPPTAAAPTVQYMAMELVEGGTLRSLMDRGRSFAELAGVLAQAAEGLGKAHGAGIIHRDLKPENIMITADGYAKIVDFGLAKLAQTGETKAGTMLGTIAYMSPEQIDGTNIGPQADVFAFGCILYECATRQRPFGGDMAMDTINKILFSEPLAMRLIAEDAPADLQPIVDKCLKKDPAERYASMREVSSALRAIGILPLRRRSSSEEVAAVRDQQPAETVDAAQAWPDLVPHRRRRAGAIVGGILKVAAVLAVLIGVWIWLTLPDVKPLRLKRPPVEEWVDYSDLPKKLQRAVVAGDPDFFKRHPMSFASIAAPDRALCVPSPLTRRVAHALYPTPSWNPIGPLRDLVIAAQMEKEMSRGRILDLYVNTAAQFDDVTGVGPAAKEFVHKSADDLSDRDAAALASKLR